MPSPPSSVSNDQCSRRTSDVLSRKSQMSLTKPKREITGTTLFDGAQARKGYALNKMCYSFNSAANRQEFLLDEDAYCRKYGLSPQQREAIRSRNVLALIAAGGNAYYLAK